MPRHKYYRQCIMRRPSQLTPGAYQTDVAWLPDKITKMRNIVRVRNSSSEPWGENWEIVGVSDPRPGEHVEAKAVDYLHQREQSDV